MFCHAMSAHLKDRMEDALGCDIESCGASLCSIQPVHSPLPVSILISLWHRAIVCKAVPELTHHKTGVGGGDIICDVTPAEALDIVKSAADLFEQMNEAYSSL